MRRFIMILSTCSTLLLSSMASASTYNLSGVLHGIFNIADVAEYHDGAGNGGYAVHLNDPSAMLGGFAVSHNNQNSDPIIHGDLSEAWISRNFSASEWNLNFGAAIGLFEDIYGTVDSYVNVFYAEDPNNNNPFISHVLDASNDVDELANELEEYMLDFTWYGTPASEFVAFGLDGTIIDGSHINGVSAVPVPAALPLFLSGVAGFGWMRRRSMQAKG